LVELSDRMNASVFRQKDFSWLFGVQFLGAFNDNVFKNGVLIFIAYQVSQTESESGLLLNLAAGLFILPFVLFSPFAGALADRTDKISLIQKLKLAEVLIMLVAGGSIILESLGGMLLTLFLMGSQSAFFGPVKYSILPQIVNTNSLTAATSWFSGSTFLSILLGTVLGGAVVLWPQGTVILSIVILINAFIGYLLSLKLSSRLSIDSFEKASLWQAMKTQDQNLKYVLLVSWFWFVGAIILSQLPTWVRFSLNADSNIAVLFLTIFSIGMGFGSLLSKYNCLTGHRHFHSLWLISMSVFLALSVELSLALEFTSSDLITLDVWIYHWMAWAVMGSFLIFAISSGIFIVPLYVLIQRINSDQFRSRVFALNNILNAIAMVLSAVLVMFALFLGLNISQIFLLLASLTAVIASVLVIKQTVFMNS
jgi:MFS family permease